MELFLNKFCVLPSNTSIKNAKTALIGIPFDSSTFTVPGQRFAPNRIREEFFFFSDFDIESEKNLFEKFVDLGNIEVVHGNFDETLNRVKNTVQGLKEKNKKIVPIFLGGEHSISLMGVSALKEFEEKIVFMQFDAHSDCWSSYSNKVFHGNFVLKLLEKNLCEKIVQVGIRSLVREEFELVEKHSKIKAFYWHEIEKKGLNWIIKRVLKECENKKIFLSIDLDCLNPKFSIGSSSPEPNGFNVKELKKFLHAFNSKKIVGVDITEVNPLIDFSRISAFTAAEILKEIILLF
jgi:agmatinase